MLVGRSMRTPRPGRERLAEVVRAGGFDADDPGLREPVGDRDRLSRHQPSAADRAEEMGDPAPLALQVADDLEGAHAVARDDIGIVVRRRLDGPFPFGDLPRQPIAFAGLDDRGRCRRCGSPRRTTASART